MERIPAVLLAGARAGDRLAEFLGVQEKALVPVRGRPMVAQVAEALANAQSVGEVVLVAPARVAEALPTLRHVPSTDSFVGNALAGAAACATASRCLMISCDIPFLTPAAVDAFVYKARARNVDLAYPIIEARLCADRFPNMRRTTLRLREGRFTGGNAVLVRPGFFGRSQRVIEDAFEARKQPARLARLVGGGLLARLLLAQVFPQVLPLRRIEQQVGRLLGGSVAAIQVDYPEIGADIDKPEDLAGLP